MVEKKAASRKNSNGSSLFTAEDDQKLIEGYRKYGNNWKDISKEYFNGKFKTNQLFQRYKRVLVAKDKESTWSKNEDIELLSVYHHFEGSWVQMSKKYYIDTRTDNQLSNRWASLKKSCCLIDTFAKLKPTVKKDLYNLYKKVRKTDGPDAIKNTSYTEIVELPDDSFPKIYLGEGRKVQKEGTKKRKSTKKSTETTESPKKRKTTKDAFIVEEEEDEEDNSSISSSEEDNTSEESPIRVIPTRRSQRVNYSKMLSDEEEEERQSSPEEEKQLSADQIQWLKAQKCPAKRQSSSSTAPFVTFDLACDEDLDNTIVPQPQQTVSVQPIQQPQQTVSVQPLAMPKIQYTVIDNHDFNLNFNDDEFLEIERFIGAPYSHYEQERTISIEDIVNQTRSIKEFFEQTKPTQKVEEEQAPFDFNTMVDFGEDLDMFDFSNPSRAPKSPLLFEDGLDF